MAKIIAFSSQKGGPGKTTLTLLAATYLHAAGIRVLVIDADSPQHSFQQTRLADLMVDQDLLTERGLLPYTILSQTISTLPGVLALMRDSKDYDVIFIDLPGTLNVKAFEAVTPYLSLVIIPVELELKSYTAGMQTVDFYQKHNSNMPLGTLWTKLKKDHVKALREGLESRFTARGVYFFKNSLRETVKIGQQISSLFPRPEFIQPIVDELMASEMLIGKHFLDELHHDQTGTA